MTAGEHFERVAVVYESLRTTDEAPVRAIGQLLPGRPVTGLDTGCGTGRYTRLLRGLLPDGSLLAAADVSAAMLAQLRAAGHGHAAGVVPLLAAAEQLPLRTASLDLVTAFNCVHHFDLGRFLAAAARVLQPGGQLFIYTRTPQQNARTIWGRYFPGFTEHEQRLHSQAALRDAVRRTDGLTMVAAQTFQHPRTSTAERLGAQAQGRHYSTFSFYTPQELRAATATFLARLPGPEVSWTDEHLLVIAAASRHDQAEPDGPASQANQDQALQVSAGQAPQRRPGGRAQITPLSAQPITGDDLAHSAQITIRRRIGASCPAAPAGWNSRHIETSLRGRIGFRIAGSLMPGLHPPDVLGDHARMVIRATRPSSISNAKCDEPFEVPLEVSTVSTIVWPMRSTRVRSIRTSGPLNSHSPQARISSWPATWRPQSSITAFGVNAPTKLSVSCALAAAMSLSTTLGSDSVSGTSLPF
jgi:SAM-dependent methyltransferase